jgi:hypothetical protein
MNLRSFGMHIMHANAGIGCVWRTSTDTNSNSNTTYYSL